MMKFVWPSYEDYEFFVGASAVPGYLCRVIGIKG